MRIARTALVCTLFALALSACSGNDAATRRDEQSGTSAGATSSSTSTTSIPSTTSSAPASSGEGSSEEDGADEEALRQALEDLMDRYDSIVERVLADPAVAGDLDNPIVGEYLALFAPDSSFPQGVLGFWEDEGVRGRSYRPGPRGRLYDSTVLSTEVLSPDEVSFTVCTLSSVEVVDAGGTVIEAQGGASGGEGVAARVDGSWLLRELTEAPPTDCPVPGATS